MTSSTGGPVPERSSEPAVGITRRRLFARAALTGAAAVAGPGLLAACGGPPSTIGFGGRGAITAVVGYGNNQTWDPLQTASAFAMAANQHAYEALVEGDPITRAPYAALAREVPTDVGGTRIRFDLRPGALWHDGKPVTADDVVFTYRRALDAKENVLVHNFFALWLDEVVQIDDGAVEFRLKFPFPYALKRIQSCKICPRHVFEGNWDKAAAGMVVGSGPYKVTEQAPASHTSFARFDGYNGPRPARYDTMLWQSIVDAAPRVAAISGARPNAQIVENIPAANRTSLQRAGRRVSFVDGGNNLFLMFRTTHAPFDDKRVRQALHYAIDKKKMIEVGLFGAGTPGTSFINPATTGSQPAATTLAYDPAKAKALLRQAGVSNLRVTLSTTNTSLVLGCINVIKEGWDAIGVRTTLNSQDTKALFSKLDAGNDFEVVATTTNPLQFGNDTDLITRYTYSAQSLNMTKYARWKGTETDRLLALQDEAARELDADRRQELGKQVLDLIADQAVIYPVVFTRLGTAWDTSRIDHVVPLGYPGINLNQVDPR